MANSNVSSHLTDNDFAQAADLVIAGGDLKLVMPTVFAHVLSCTECEDSLTELIGALTFDEEVDC